MRKKAYRISLPKWIEEYRNTWEGTTVPEEFGIGDIVTCPHCKRDYVIELGWGFMWSTESQ